MVKIRVRCRGTIVSCELSDQRKAKMSAGIKVIWKVVREDFCLEIEGRGPQTGTEGASLILVHTRYFSVPQPDESTCNNTK